MRKLTYVLLALLAIGFTACNSNPIIGEWKMEMPEGEEGGMPSMDMSFIFKNDGNVNMKMSFMGNEKIDSATYVIEGDEITFKKEGEKDETVKYSIEGNKMTISDMGNGMMNELTLIKQED